MKKPVITVHLWTERFLGRADKAVTFLSMLKTLDGGNWIPDKWGQFEPIKNSFTPDSEERLITDWMEERQGGISNSMYFTKKKPGLLLGVTSWRSRVPNLNYVWFDIEATEFTNPEGVVRLKRIVVDFVLWAGAAYATAQHSSQRHYRSAPGNPRQRLDQLNWLTFFGAPYLRLLGEKSVGGCPFYSCETVADGLLLTAAERPDSPEMVGSDAVLLSLERCLGANIFATEDYPATPCRVPNFDLRETVNPVTVH
ncbi:MAG TPA: hypothetical protein VIX90_02585 [Edaphobacter sp.]